MNTRKLFRPEACASAALLALAMNVAHAVDGVTLINQSKAQAGGVTQGDAPGFPVTISRSGSYRLSGHLSVPDADTTAIVVTANDVTIDLNGYSIRGPVDCGHLAPVSCNPAGQGSGIAVPSSGGDSQHVNLAVHNGTIRGMGGRGIDVATAGVLIDRVRMLHNGAGGIYAQFALIQNAVIVRNGGSGVMGNGNSVQASLIMNNGGYGISANFASGFGDTVLQGNALGDVSPFGAKPTSGNRCGGNPC